MYCGLDNAYKTASDLLKSDPNVVYDNIISDDDSFFSNFKKCDIINTQGEFENHSEIPSNQNTIVQSGTPISEILHDKQIKQKTQDDIPNTIKKQEVMNNNIDVANLQIPKNIEENLKNNECSANPQTKQKNVEHFNLYEQNYFYEIRDGLIMTLIGIIIIFMIDILVRICHKL